MLLIVCMHAVGGLRVPFNAACKTLVAANLTNYIIYTGFITLVCFIYCMRFNIHGE